MDFDGLISDLLEVGWREKRRQELYFSEGARQKRRREARVRRGGSVGKGGGGEDKGDKRDKGAKGAKGDKGDKGDTGEGGEREESESEEEENRELYEAICYNAGPHWRNEYVANLSLMTQVNVNNGSRRLIRRM